MKRAAFILGVYFLLLIASISTRMQYAYGTALVWTDKPDYSPGDTVIIFGSGFLANTPTTITITYPDSTVHTIYPLTGSNGFFNCTYPLNGITGTYTVTATDGTNTATTTFTDSVTDFRQYATLNDKWINSILQSSNSMYYEGMSVPQRTVFTEIPSTSGNVHTLTLSHEATKGGIHAYDWLTGWNQGNDPPLSFVPWGDNIGPPATLAGICQNLHNAPGSGAYEIFVDVPDDPFISKDGSTQSRINAYETLYGNRQIRICGNAPFTSAGFSAMSHDVTNGDDTGDSFIAYTLTWTSASDQILVEMAGHLAMSGDPGINPIAWGIGLGSGQVGGGPYHFKLDKLDGASLGSQDNQIMGANILMVSMTTTELSAPIITLGGSITDLATVTGGGATPTGTVDFQVSTDGGVTWNKFGATKSLFGGSAASDGFMPLAVGTYYFRAVYSGDGEYPSSQSGDTAEPLVVTSPVLVPSTTTTALSETAMTLGDSVTDTVTVTGAGPVPSGSVTFQVQFGAGSFVTFSTKSLDATGHATSDSYTPLAAGSYYFRALYLGDNNYQASQSPDDAEPLTVDIAASTVITTLSQMSITLGQSVTDAVTVTGLGGSYPAPTGTVTFYVEIPGSAVFVQFGAVKALSGGSATSDLYAPPAVGIYYFRAVYSGDSNYVGETSTNEEKLIVLSVQPQVGGKWMPIETLQPLVPWLSAVAMAAIAASSVGVRRIKKRQD